LHVRRRQSLFNFLEKIPIASKKKKQRLIDILSEHYKYGHKNKPLFLFEKELLNSIAQEPKTTAELAQNLRVSKQAIIGRVRKLKKEGKVKKLVQGNNKDSLRINRYKSQVDLPNSAYSLLGEQVLDRKLVTKTIKAIEEIPLPQVVFDITNSLRAPAFVLSNNVVVHNSTRHEIIQKLYARHYIAGLKAIEPNKVSFAVIDSLQQHCKTVTEPKMTSELEKEMDEIATGKKPKTDVVDDSRKLLLEILETLLKEKNNIGTDLRKALTEDSVFGKCTRAECDGQLVMRKGKTGKRFVGCSRYPNCNNSFPLPQLGRIVILNKTCPECNAPTMKVYNKRSSYEMCINHNCKTKEEWKKKAAERAAKASQTQTTTAQSTEQAPQIPQEKPKAIAKEKTPRKTTKTKKIV
jgi:DNA topoisomerase-1